MVLSPEDYAILSYQPITSRTYFFARLANLLIYVSSLTTALSLAPVLAYSFTLGFNPLLGLITAGLAYLSTFSVTLVLVLSYALILKVVPAHRLQRALGYFQLATSFVIYGGYLLIPRLMNRTGLFNFTIQKSFWVFLNPASWFASLLELSQGHWGMSEWLPGLLALLAVPVLLYFAQGKLSLTYAQRLLALSDDSAQNKTAKAPRSRWSWWFRQGESRVVALLIRNQFKYDHKFHLSVLALLPLTVLYLLWGLQGGSLQDPFVYLLSDFGRSMFLYLAIFIFPLMLKPNLTHSDAYQAAWVFFATPCDRAQLIRAMKSVVMVYFVLPYLGVLTALFVYFFGNPLHALLHGLMLLILMHLFLQLVFLVPVDLPFSLPRRRGQATAYQLVLAFLVMIIALVIIPLLIQWTYPHPLNFALALSGGIALSWALERVLFQRLRKKTQAVHWG